MTRVLSLYLPTWPTDRLRRVYGNTAPPSDAPLILKGSDGRRRVISALDDTARRLGLYPGMPVAKAEALVSDLTILEAEPDADALALEKLAIWALKRYSPSVCVDPPNGLVLDIDGAAHLHGGEQGTVGDAISRLADLGITAYAALADSWGAAHALVRFGGQPSVIVGRGDTAKAILTLPVAALRLPSDTVEDLELLGIDTIGELASKPRAPLAHRFGQLLWRRVDQAFGRLPEPIEPVDAPELMRVQRIFAEPIGTAETLAKYTGRLVDQMCERLEEAGQGVKRLDLHHTRVDNRLETTFVVMAKPVRDPKRLTRLLCDKIETVDPGFGIEKMTLIATCAEPLMARQQVASFSEAPRPDIEELWDTIDNRYGTGRLYRAVSVATDIPERAIKRVPPTVLQKGSRRNTGYKRPERLIRPEQIQALAVLPDHPPRAFTWRKARYHVVAANGPERVKGEWWQTDAESGKIRDYFILEVDSGERFWVFRAGDGQHEGTGSLNWYLHGQFR